MKMANKLVVFQDFKTMKINNIYYPPDSEENFTYLELLEDIEKEIRKLHKVTSIHIGILNIINFK